jgi:cytochrome c peroxidase
MKIINNIIMVLTLSYLLVACSGGGGGGGDSATQAVDEVAVEGVEEDAVEDLEETEITVVEDEITAQPDAQDIELIALIDTEGLTGDPSIGRNLPAIASAMAQLGKQLFYAKNLGGVQDAACVSCHHPTLGGGDNLSLSVGVNAVDSNGAVDPNGLGLGRFHLAVSGLPTVPRNAPTVFNSGMWDKGMFWDSRIESVAGETDQNGSGGAIVTPDSVSFTTGDATLPTGTTLPAAQARFPVTSVDEMRGTFLAAGSNANLRAGLSSRLQSIAQWQTAFSSAFGDPAINYDRIGLALGEFERSMVFIDSPWKAYVEGDITALTDEQKAGAILFLSSQNDGGAGCSRCHSGDNFSDEEHHIVAFPQIGPGKGNDSGNVVTNDFGRENISGNNADRFHFRTASLLNVAVTAPYTHAGAYQTLDKVVAHYDNPRREVNAFFGATGGVPFVTNSEFCALPQVVDLVTFGGLDCETMYLSAYDDSIDAVDRLDDNDARSSVLPTPNLDNDERDAIVAFLEALTDPCVVDRACLNPWIVDVDDVGSFPDALPLVAQDRDNIEL